ncbi:MAG TPA: MFS transporter, partial [Rhodoglobus sp.]|nr:MFS transporter [Rhodoglobus sp.]
MLTTFLVAIEATVLSTAVPSIVADLGDFPLFPWLFSVYLLAQAVTVPVYAKLADTVGRKPIILIGIGLFLLGSILSAFAWSMPALIAFRVIQGLGAGAVLPISITIAGDIYTVEERAKVQGYLASMWAVASVVGPTLGGLFAQFDAWRGIFIVNIPLCLLAAWMLTRTFHEKITRTAHRIDYAGAVLLTVALTALLLAVLEGGQAWAWNSLPSILLFGGGALVLVAFLLVERRAAEPILPLWVFTRRLVLVVSIFGLGIGATLTGLTSYVPLYLQGALGVSPLIAGFALATLTVGWPIAAAVSGRLYLRIGFRNTMFIGMGLVL